ncbi:MAG: rRNA maturation RNase YbeY [Alphaproteobacteria bacterium]|nr:rRNA maturation RNase YbeY [Alphaproteobacteria bacterium]
MIVADILIADPAWEQALPEIAALVDQAARATPGEGEAAILLTDDLAVRALNARFRGRDSATNVLSFPAEAPAVAVPPEAMHLGDIALALGVCEAEAQAQGKPLADHVRHLVIHGLLHLLGYDHVDNAEAEAMEGLERDILRRMDVPDPYGDAWQDRNLDPL